MSPCVCCLLISGLVLFCLVFVLSMSLSCCCLVFVLFCFVLMFLDFVCLALTVRWHSLWSRVVQWDGQICLVFTSCFVFVSCLVVVSCLVFVACLVFVSSVGFGFVFWLWLGLGTTFCLDGLLVCRAYAICRRKRK